MSHYTLQSGKDTSTCSFKCEGCFNRYSYRRLMLIDTENHWNVAVCCYKCSIKANERITDSYLKALGNPVVEDIVLQSSKGSFTYMDLYRYLTTKLISTGR